MSENKYVSPRPKFIFMTPCKVPKNNKLQVPALNIRRTFTPINNSRNLSTPNLPFIKKTDGLKSLLDSFERSPTPTKRHASLHPNCGLELNETFFMHEPENERDPATLTSNRTFVENIGERTISIAAILKELGMEKYADIIENVGFDLKAMAGMDYGCLDGLDIDDSDRSIIIRAFELYRD